MTPESMPRTRERVDQVFWSVLSPLLSESDDLSAVLSRQVVDQIIDAAWRHQFDADRGSFVSELRAIVRDAVEAWSLEA